MKVIPDLVDPSISLHHEQIPTCTALPGEAGYAHVLALRLPTRLHDYITISDNYKVASTTMIVSFDGAVIGDYTGAETDNFRFDDNSLTENGVYDITVTAIDHVNRTATVKYRIVLSKELPAVHAVVETAPINGWYVQKSISVGLSFEDGAYLDGVSLSAELDGVPCGFSPTDRSPVIAITGEGIHTLRTIVSAEGSEPKEAVWTYALDSAPPAAYFDYLTILDPDGALRLSVTGVASDTRATLDAAGIGNVSIYRVNRNGDTLLLGEFPGAESADTQFTLTFAPETRGDPTVTCRIIATDILGNSMTTDRILKVSGDMLPPIVSVTGPSYASVVERQGEKEYVLAMAIRVTNSASINLYEEHCAIRIGDYALNDVIMVKQLNESYAASVSIPVSAIPDGAADVRVVLRTLSEVPGVAVVSGVLFDKTAPELVLPDFLELPNEEPPVETAFVEYSIQANDAGTGVSKITWWVNAAAPATTYGTSSSVRITATGLYTLRVLTSDLAGNTREVEYVGTLDNGSKAVLFANPNQEVVVKHGDPQDPERLIQLVVLGGDDDALVKVKVSDNEWMVASQDSGGYYFSFLESVAATYTVHAGLFSASTGALVYETRKQVRVNALPSDLQVHARPARLGETIQLQASFVDQDSGVVADGPYSYTWWIGTTRKEVSGGPVAVVAIDDALGDLQGYLGAGKVPVSYAVTDRWGDTATSEPQWIDITPTTSGMLLADEVWTGSVDISGVVIVPAGISLTLENATVSAVGTAVYTAGMPGYNVRIIVQSGGNLSVEGEGNILRKSPSFGERWGGVLIFGRGTIENALFEGAIQGIAAHGTASVSVSTSTFKDCLIGFHALGSSPIINDCDFSGSEWYGVKEEAGSAPLLTDCSFTDNAAAYYRSGGTILSGSEINFSMNIGNVGE